MVGLSVILEGYSYNDVVGRNTQVLSKGSMIKPPLSPSGIERRNGFPSTGFLDRCFLCKQKLQLGKDIYMYEGDKGFCSVECRWRQIFMDEEEAARYWGTTEYNCSLAAIKKPQQGPSNSSPPSSSHRGKGTRNRAANAFAY